MRTNCHIYCLPFPCPLFPFSLPIFLFFFFPFLSSLSLAFVLLPIFLYYFILLFPFSAFCPFPILLSCFLFYFPFSLPNTVSYDRRGRSLGTIGPRIPFFLPLSTHSISPFPPIPLLLFHSRSHHLSRPSNMNCHSRPPRGLLILI